MAKSPQKSNDPGNEALSAIEDALQGREADMQSLRPALSVEPVRRANPLDADLFHDEVQAPTFGDDVPVRRAANDDRAAIGKILQTLQRKPARMPYFVATLLSALWLIGGAAIALVFKAKLLELAAQPEIGVPVIVAAAAAVIVPIAVFYALAHTIRRMQDLRLVTQTMAEVAMRLAEPETAARDQIVNVGQAIRREVAAMGDGIERALARAAELESLVHNEVSALERAYNDNEVRIRDMLSELANQRDSLVGQAEQVRSAISGVHLGLTHDITSVGDILADRVNEVAQRVTRTLTEKGEHITLALGQTGDSMIDALADRGSTLLQRLEVTSDKATGAIGSASDRLTSSLNFKTDHIHDEFTDLSARLQQSMASRLDQVTQGFSQKANAVIDSMAGRSQQMTDTLAQTGNTLANSIAARVEEVNSTLRSTGDSLLLDLNVRGGDVVSKMEQTGARITDTIVARGNKVADTFRDNSEALANSIDSNGKNVADMLAARQQSFDELFNRSGTQLSEKIARESSALSDQIIRNVAEFDRTVKTYGGELVDSLGKRTQDVAESMRTYVDTFDQRVTSRNEEISTTLDQRLGQFEQLMANRVGDLAQTLSAGGKDVVAALDTRIAEVGDTIARRGDDVADKIAARVADIDTTLGTRADQVAGTLDSRIGKFEDLLANRVQAVTAQIETSGQTAADTINARMEELAKSITGNAAAAEQSLGQLAATSTQAIRESAGDAERSLTALSDNVGGALKKNAEDVERRLVALSTEVAAGFLGKSEEITATVTRQTNEMTTLLSDKSGGVLAAIVEKGQEFSDSLTQATDQAVKAIEDRGFVFGQTMMSNSEELARMINTAGEAATDSVNRTLSQLHGVAQAAAEQSRQTAAASVSEMLETHTMLRSDSTALYERLREANILLQEVLSGAHENMSALENTMMLRVTDFVQAMTDVTQGTNTASSRIENTVDAFRDTAHRMVNDLGSLTTQFEVHGRELNKAIEQLDRSNMRTEDVVNERRVTLDSLISTLDIRTEDLDQRLKRFAGLLDESLEAAGGRAREIARVVSESSVESAHVIADQFERMRATAESEREATSVAMRAVYEQATGESHTMLHQAADRFAEIMGSLKQMAADMQRELDNTREELRRGVLELPQETSESAMQMRRVLVDQIEALAELNRIVARHGRSIEQNDVPRRTPREEVASRAEVAPPRPAQRNTDAASFAPPVRSRPSADPQSAAAIQQKGWLTDLLNRASREGGEDPAREAPRPAVAPAPVVARNDERMPRHSIESLDSLSVDIARMIDHDAAADLWDRYKRGERNVFTRRLYTLQGQKAFDDIRVKYRADREFKQTVDRYIAEFERLLEDVSRDDRGQVVARTYLTSETGKVYTMLAHAAGRFDQAQ